MASIKKTLAASPLLDREWGARQTGIAAMKRAGLTTEDLFAGGYELAQRNGRWAVYPVAKPETVPAPTRKRKAKAIEPTPQEITVHHEPEVSEALAAHQEPEPTDEQIETWMDARPITATRDQTAPQATFSLLLEESFTTLEDALAWARDAARKLRTTVRVRDAAGTIVGLMLPLHQAAKPRRDGVRSDTTQAMVAAMTVPGGITAEQIQAAGGWRNKPAIVHMDRWAAARGFKLHIHSGTGKKRYEAVFPPA